MSDAYHRVDPGVDGLKHYYSSDLSTRRTFSDGSGSIVFQR